MSDLETFRAETRAWLEENCPPEMRTPVKGDEDVWGPGAILSFNPTRRRSGWNAARRRATPCPIGRRTLWRRWPFATETKVLRQEMAALGCRSPLNSFGIWMRGPARKFGTRSRRCVISADCPRRNPLVPRLFRAWLGQRPCFDANLWRGQGRPLGCERPENLDLLRRQGRLDFCLVRTDKTNKYRGISFLLFDMETPGVTTKPIKLISGNSPFCEGTGAMLSCPSTRLSAN